MDLDDIFDSGNFSLREKASIALIERERHLIDLARQQALDILGEEEIEVGRIDLANHRVEFVIDEIKFRVDIMQAYKPNERADLEMYHRASWDAIKCLADIGEKLRQLEPEPQATGEN